MQNRLFGRCLALVLALCSLLPSVALARDELKNTDPEKYYIELDTRNQVVTVYEKDDQGEYTRVVRRMLCTSGKTEPDGLEPATPTPSGRWKIGARERFGKFAAFNAEYARYWTQVVGGIYFHSIMFSKRDITTLKKSPYNGLGKTGSHGCIRLYVEDAKWLYYHACPGTTVNVIARKGDRELTASLRSEMSFSEYDLFQQNIYDTPPLPDRSAWIVVEGAQMRTGNGTNDKLIRRLPEGTQVEILQEGDPWVKVKVDDREGYVKRCYITYTQGVMESQPEGRYVGSTVYLYEEPSTKSTRLYKVARDSTIEVVAELTNGWTLVDYWGTLGYIQSRLIKTGWATIYHQEEGQA
jgi:SH3-like domain-containing protein